MDNWEVKVFLGKNFGNKIKFLYSHKVTKSLLSFSSDVCSAQNLAETIRNTDFIAKYARELQNCFLGYDFGLEDRFCDASELRISCENIHVPK